MGQNKVARNIWQTIRGIVWLLICKHISNTKALRDQLPKGAKNRLTVISLFLGAVVFKLTMRILDKFVQYF
jgi:hypothetical protein